MDGRTGSAFSAETASSLYSHTAVVSALLGSELQGTG